MKKRLLTKLICPNFGTRNFQVFGLKIERDGQIISNIDHDQLNDLDDIKEGVIVDFDKLTAYPISDFVLSMLCDEDVDFVHYKELFASMSEEFPAKYAEVISSSIERLDGAKFTDEGAWNREEMEYYDADVATAELRQEFLKKIKSVPLWHIYIEREKHLVEKANLSPGSSVLEVGCGNARTLDWLAKPETVGYEYAGIDISWKRMILARMAMPEGDFVQASALRLPFSDKSFSHTVAFSSLHHLPDHRAGLVEALRVLKQSGQFLIHEPIVKKAILPEGKMDWLRNMLSEYEHSEHDNEIDINMVHELVVAQDSCKITHEHYNTSIVRKLMTIGPMAKLPFKSNRTWWNIIIALDHVYVSLFCRRHNALGPGAVFFVISKSGEFGQD